MTPGSPIVSGARKELAAAGIWNTILSLILNECRNPLAAWRLIRTMVVSRKSLGYSRRTRKYARSQGRFFWDLHSPGWPSRTFNRFVRQNLAFLHDRPAGLQSVIFGITDSCRMKCLHCYNDRPKKPARELTAGQLVSAMRQFDAFGLAQVQFSGGEPLERFDDLLILIKGFHVTMDCWVLTSGYGLTRERALLLKEAGATGVSISCDHWNGVRHDAFRGTDGSFSWVQQAARNLREADIVVSLALCPTPEFISMDNLLRYTAMAKEAGASFIHIIEPRAVGRYARMPFELDSRHRDVLDDYFLTVNYGPQHRHDPIVSYVGYFQRRSGCFGAGNRYLYVDPGGDIYGCPFCPKSAGNCVTEPLPAIIARLRAIGCKAYATAPVSGNFV